MKDKARINYFANPSFGLIPFLVYATFSIFIDYKIGLVVSLFTAVLLIVSIRWFIRRKIFPVFIVISFLILSLSFVASILIPPSFLYIYQPFIVDFLLLNAAFQLLLNRYKFIRKILLFSHRRLNFSLKSELYELFFLCRYLIVAFEIYLTVALFYLWFFKEWHTPELHSFYLNQLRFIVLIGAVLFGHIRLYLLNRHFQQEKWLPIIDEEVRVIGRIARSESYRFKEKYLHPHVRILIYHKEMLYLCQRHPKYILDADKYDTPLHQDLYYGQEVQNCVDSLLREAGLSVRQQPRFCFRYLFEHVKIRRLMFLYILHVEDENCFKNNFFANGKLWTEQEIEYNLRKGVFFDCIEQEFEFLQSTVFPVMKMIKKNERINNYNRSYSLR